MISSSQNPTNIDYNHTTQHSSGLSINMPITSRSNEEGIQSSCPHSTGTLALPASAVSLLRTSKLALIAATNSTMRMAVVKPPLNKILPSGCHLKGGVVVSPAKAVKGSHIQRLIDPIAVVAVLVLFRRYHHLNNQILCRFSLRHFLR